MSEWYCRLFGQELGPMSRDELVFLAKKGNLRRDTQVRRAAEGVWRPAGQIPGLFADEHRDQSAQGELPVREQPRAPRQRVRNASPAKKPKRDGSPTPRRASLPSISIPSLPWLKAIAILVAIVGVGGAGRAAYQAAAATPVNHRAIAQELEQHFAEVERSRQTDLDYAAAAILKGRLRAQINSLRLALRNSATGSLEATLDAAANSVSTMAEDLAFAKSPAGGQAFAQRADEFQRLIAQAKQAMSST